MTTNVDTETDVLVVGAGPTGLTMASELLRRGLRTRIIDESEAPTTLSKAIAVHARTLEIFDDLGIADEMLDRGVVLRGATMEAAGATIASVDFAALDTRFPFVLSISQVETEAVLDGLVTRHGGRVERKTRLTRLRDDGDRVEAVVVKDGAEEVVRARYVMGCDGAHSTVRKAIGATFEGHSYDALFVLADVRVDWDVSKDRITTFFAEDGIAACFPMKDDRWRIIATSPSSSSDVAPTIEALRDVTARRSRREPKMSDVAWIAAFRIHCRQVDRYRKGRVFLAGDAAHIHSPAGGQGMNTGIQDAHNLAWKLALVHEGVGRDILLESYEKERHAVGRALLRVTDVATKVGNLQGASLTAVRNQVARFAASFEPVRRQLAHNISELSVGYDESPLNGERMSSILTARLSDAAAAESPTVATRLTFRGGPRPGARAPDGRVRVLGATTTSSTFLAKIWSGRSFTLLLFDGRSPSAEGYATLSRTAERVRDTWGAHVRTLLITPGLTRPAALPANLEVLHDEGGLEERYGAQTECLCTYPPRPLRCLSKPARRRGGAARLPRHRPHEASLK